MTMAWKKGDFIQDGKYEIDRILGRGGYGHVYLAHERSGRNVAIKTLHDHLRENQDCEKFEQDFMNEVRRLAQFSHLPFIVSIYDVIKEGDVWGIVMEYVDGKNLDHSGIIPEDLALLYIQQISSALSNIHENGLLHRDIKPSNILVRTKTNEAVLVDFGIAREFTSKIIQTQTPLWTPFYAAPEQYIEKVERSASSDIYSLAATLYKILTGKEPESAPSRMVGCILKTPKQINPNISNVVESAILKGLELQASDRPQTIKAWLEIMRLKLISPSEYKTIQPNINLKNAEESITEVKEKRRIQRRVKFFIEELSSTYSQSRRQAIQELGRLGEKASSAVPSLIRIIENVDDTLFDEVGIVLSKIVSTSVIPLSLLLNHEKVEVRRKAASTLEQIGAEALAATPQIIKALEDIDSEVRQYAIKTIGKIGLPAKDAIPSLIRIIKEENSIRVNPFILSELGTDAVLALETLGVEAQSAIPVILETLRDIKGSFHSLSLLSALEAIGYDINMINFYYINDGITRNGQEHLSFQREARLNLELEAQRVGANMISLPYHQISVSI